MIFPYFLLLINDVRSEKDAATLESVKILGFPPQIADLVFDILVSGSSCVVFGKASGLNAATDISSLNW